MSLASVVGDYSARQLHRRTDAWNEADDHERLLRSSDDDVTARTSALHREIVSRLCRVEKLWAQLFGGVRESLDRLVAILTGRNEREVTLETGHKGRKQERVGG